MDFFIVQLAKLGDIIQAVPLAKRLKKRGSLGIVVNKDFEEVAKSLGIFDQVVGIDLENLPSFKAPKCKVVYSLNLNVKGRIVAEAFARNGAEIVGWRGVERAQGEPWQHLFLMLLSRFRRFVGINLVDLFLNLDGAKGPGDMTISLDGEGPGIEDPYVVIHPFTRNPKRNWSYSLFSKLSLMLMEKGFRVVVTGVEREGKVVERLFPKGVENLCGKTNFIQLYHLLKNASLFISCDTGPIHVAALSGAKKVIGIYLGPAFFPETSPYTDKALILSPRIGCYPCFEGFPCSRGTHCREDIKPEDVIYLFLKKEGPHHKVFFDEFGLSFSAHPEDPEDILRDAVTELARGAIRKGYKPKKERITLAESLEGKFLKVWRRAVDLLTGEEACGIFKVEGRGGEE